MMLFIDFIKHFGNISIGKAYIQAKPANQEEGSGRTTTLLVFLLGEKIIDNQAE